MSAPYDAGRYKLAMQARSHREFENARTLFRECCQSTSDEAWRAFFVCAIAECFSTEGNIAAAAEEFEAASKIDPGPLSLMAWAEFEMEERNDPDNAIAIAERAHNIAQHHPEIGDRYQVKVVQFIENCKRCRP